MKLSEFIKVAALSVVMQSCEKSNLGTVDVQTEAPLLSNASTTPDSIYIDNLTPVNGLYSINTTVKVRMSFRGGAQTVTASVLRPTTSEEVFRSSLRDDGTAPDQVANDSIFSGKVEFNIQRAFAGRYRIQFSSRTPEGITSNVIEKPLKLSRRNSAPVLLEATSPDTIDLPTSGFISVQFTASASDSDGLADIREVFFKRDTLNTKFILRDDGGVGHNSFDTSSTGRITLSTGDVAAGDGKFSILLPVTPANTRGTRRIKFQATDSFGDTSATIQRFFTIR